MIIIKAFHTPRHPEQETLNKKQETPSRTRNKKQTAPSVATFAYPLRPLRETRQAFHAL